jgi:hypothetical protein
MNDFTYTERASTVWTVINQQAEIILDAWKF